MAKWQNICTNKCGAINGYRNNKTSKSDGSTRLGNALTYVKSYKKYRKISIKKKNQVFLCTA